MGSWQCQDPAIFNYVFIVCLLTRPRVLLRAAAASSVSVHNIESSSQHIDSQVKQGHLKVVKNLRCHHVQFSVWNSTTSVHVQSAANLSSLGYGRIRRPLCCSLCPLTVDKVPHGGFHWNWRTFWNPHLSSKDLVPNLLG